MEKHCAVFCGGDPVSAQTIGRLPSGCCIIAADSGYRLAQELGLVPDLVIGDFDSSSKPEHSNIKVYPVEKDDTDLMLALREGLRSGCTRFHIYGATGGRLDHTVAAIQSLAFLLDNSASGEILSDSERIELIQIGAYSAPKMPGYTLSLFAYSDTVKGLSISGAKYCCKKLDLVSSFPIGVSNEVTDECADITFDSGRLLIIRSEL